MIANCIALKLPSLFHVFFGFPLADGPGNENELRMRLNSDHFAASSALILILIILGRIDGRWSGRNHVLVK